MSDPLIELVSSALEIMNRSFVDAAKPQSAACEFYHQFRKLWDKGIPVGMGLGHLLIKPIDELSYGIHRLVEGGKADETLAAVCFGMAKAMPGFARTLAVTFQPCEPQPGITFLSCDLPRGRVVII